MALYLLDGIHAREPSRIHVLLLQAERALQKAKRETNDVRFSIRPPCVLANDLASRVSRASNKDTEVRRKREKERRMDTKKGRRRIVNRGVACDVRGRCK
jgi:hypothetical protein